ncbi:hypothetical protein BDA96_08G184000 [Sorghum bicolor]|uniref:AAA+ ATPase domain-containing protein n=2 Tax=Sorghum bicolor TaxID=4558 RepID=A0A1B6PE61_SORBI|nr:putative disease resistance protein RGA3 [Sorghum bicolor]XP_021301665.1 putative disease resistance protein RGA3 [Sorghum bicolor]XP_021301666.1 putative disease resistance protein RGA3 [Sorghum bicolor]KAG0521706.1 hypothetical protein BDA96_08G184000 [Sorghum bicolor]KXG23974.1 hypothetical protein SORBI_3008G166400 [Sorghum bicolor]|eukprot:XP_021301663.1 putative disease resistance protein RGA3 [Sorghum bicolor]
MATAMVSAAFSVVGKALAPLTDGLLKDWAASVELGDNVESLERELKLVKALLEPTAGREIDNSSLKELLEELKELGYDAEDVLDELDYFRIQDELDGTFHAADKHAKGVTHNLALNVRHTAKAVGKQIWLPSCFSSAASSEAKANQGVNRHKAKLNSRSCCNPIHTVGKCFPCSSLPSDPDDDNGDKVDYGMHNNSPQRNLITDNEPPKLRFNRVDASKRMQDVVKKLRLVRQDVSGIIATLGSNWSTVPNIAQSRPVTTSQSIEQKLYGRDLLMNNIIHDITKGKHSTEILTVIPIVGPGGIGKTTLAQHIYHSPDVQDHFDVRVWTCVSLNFNVNKLIEEIQGYIPKIDGESSNGTAGELIRQRLKNKRLLLVLDDIWDCSDEDEWKRLLVPFQKSQVQGNIIIVTTRFPAQAQIVVRKNDQPIYLKGLENKEFEELFLEVIFGDDDQSRKDHTSLLETGFKIACRLKGSPLAAKTVGRLLKTELDLAHWTRILESKEWEHSSGKNDIMPALKLSFDHLPSQLQQCFSFCALFPQDYIFKREELVNFWIGQEVLHSLHGQNKRVEDIGLSHLTELFNYGFLENKVNEDGQTFYIVHDLLHELARKVSSLECLNIESSQSHVSTLEVLPSIRHLSINIDATSAKDRLTLKNSVEDFNTLGRRLKVEKLRTLMIFGEHHGCFVKAFGELFREAKALRVIFLSGTSYNVEDLLHNFYQLVHLRYLWIGGSFRYEARFPNKLSRFYHMMVLDAHHYAYIDVLPRDMSNLGKLRHFHVQDDSTHSSIVEVGKLKSLQELRRFVVKQEDKGFELREIGHLVHLCGSLSIYNLENVRVKEEVDEAKLLQKSRLQELTLHWDNIDRSPIDYTLEEHVLERLKPNNNLLKLSIKGHRGTTCPSWLGTNLSFKSLESLCLDGVAWKTYPPIGDLWTVNRLGTSDNIPNIRFENLRRLELVNLPWLKKWVVHAPCQLFRFLEVLIISGCSQLEELSFQHLACCQQRKEPNVNSFPRLMKLKIKECPQLLSFPPIPWNKALCTINIEGIGSSCLDKFVCEKRFFSPEYDLTIEGKDTIFVYERKKDTIHSKIWNVLDFHSLTGLNTLRMERCQPPPLSCLQILSSLRALEISCSSNAFSFVEADSHVKYQFPVEHLSFHEWNASGKELTQLLTYFPRLSYMLLLAATKITGLSVTGQQATEITAPLCSSNNVDPTAEDEIVASEEAERGLLLLPPQLQDLWIGRCPDLSLLRSNPHDDSNEEDGGTGGRGGGLQGLTSLRRLRIWGCPKLLSAYTSYSSFSSSFPFPNSLEHLEIKGAVGTEVLLPLSNLTSLTSLDISSCGDLRGEGLLSLLAQGHLTKLSVIQTPNFFVDSDPSQVHEQEIPSCSSKLQELQINDVAGFTTAAIHRSLIFSSLTKLNIQFDHKLGRFTEQQEALVFVDSLEDVTFRSCFNLQSLPERLHTLHNLKRLYIRYCEAIQMLPKDGLPSSLEELYISNCPELQSLPKDCLPDSLRELTIEDCPAIRSLPEVDDLPSSLRELYVSDSKSEELRRQCRKLINIIPIVRV